MGCAGVIGITQSARSTLYFWGRAMAVDLTLDAVGVGVGPFNLSLAALLAPTGFKARFFERSAAFQWHPGLLFPEATIQVSYLKDLVTLADPTSPESFTAFLSANKRRYLLINRTEARLRRQKFS